MQVPRAWLKDLDELALDEEERFGSLGVGPGFASRIACLSLSLSIYIYTYINKQTNK